MDLTFRRVIMPIGLGMLVALGLALLLAISWLNAPSRDVFDLLMYLMASGSVSLGIGLTALRWLQLGRGRLWVQSTLTCTLGVWLALFNIFLTAGMMFDSTHDFYLLILLLLFAAVMSIGLGYVLSHALTQRVSALQQGAQSVASGDLLARVPPHGDDELATLAREFNRMAEQLAAAAAERDRLEGARRDLIAAVSHDLRTPLASLRAMTEALADGLVDDPATHQRYLATMRNQIGHLSSLIDDLFELAQLDSGALQLELQRVPAGDLVSDAIEGMYPQAAARGVQLRGSIAPEVGPLLVAPQKIERVLYNLVTNAIRHTPSDGVVTIAVAPPPHDSAGDHPPSEGTESPPVTEFVCFEITDTGEGIAPDDLPRVFEHFYRGEKSRSRATGGAGLGLAIARGIVEAHGGRIWIESERDIGTRVRFTLPSAP